MTGPPDWVYDAVIYQIFPDRFARAPMDSNGHQLDPWGAEPTYYNFMGGNLPGITAKLHYLQQLGVNTLYLNPVFPSPENHRYGATDYKSIDALLGTMGHFEELLARVHEKGMHLIMDIAFNHCSDQHPHFQDAIHDPDSTYRNWFTIREGKIKKDGWAQRKVDGRWLSYRAWWGYGHLPDFNIDEPAVRQHHLDVIAHWTKKGVDAFRFDVPNHIDDERFWNGVYMTAAEINPDIALFAEIWHDWPHWLERMHMDGQMNYPLARQMIGWVSGNETNWEAVIGTGYQDAIRPLNVDEFAASLEHLMRRHQPHYRHLVPANMNLLSSHDVSRPATLIGDEAKIRQLYTLLFTLPGMPMVYYGDELGMQGGRDPDNRRAFPLNGTRPPIYYTIQQLAHLRRELPSLRYGDYQTLYSKDDVLAFERRMDRDRAVVIMNNSDVPAEVAIPGLGGLEEKIKEGPSYNGTVEIAPRDTRIFST